MYPSFASIFECAAKPIGKPLKSPVNFPEYSPFVFNVFLSISIGGPPSHKANKLPLKTTGLVFPGFVGNFPKLSMISVACVHAPLAPTISAAPFAARVSCALYRSVSTIAERIVTSPFSFPNLTSCMHPSPSNQCAYFVDPNRHLPGPSRYNVPPFTSSGTAPKTVSHWTGCTLFSIGSNPPLHGYSLIARSIDNGGLFLPADGRGTETSCGGESRCFRCLGDDVVDDDDAKTWR